MFYSISSLANLFLRLCEFYEREQTASNWRTEISGANAGTNAGKVQRTALLATPVNIYWAILMKSPIVGHYADIPTPMNTEVVFVPAEWYNLHGINKTAGILICKEQTL